MGVAERCRLCVTGVLAQVQQGSCTACMQHGAGHNGNTNANAGWGDDVMMVDNVMRCSHGDISSFLHDNDSKT